MLLQISWTDSAKKSYEQVINYLETHWGEREVSRLLLRTDVVLKLIGHNPRMYPEITPDIHRCVLTKHNSLFYKIEIDKVIILACWDIRKDPKDLKIN
jgi:plasmid stabilization system protein ParE